MAQLMVSGSRFASASKPRLALRRPSRHLAVLGLASLGRALSSSSREYALTPRAAVAVTVRRPTSPPSYCLIQRGKPPGEGRWSIPGGALELGEETLAGARRELAEETGLRDGVSWHGAPFTTSDAIYRDDDGRVRFHYLIAQCFCEAAPTAALAAGDDALDARWFTLDDVANAGGDVAGNCRRILARAEALFAAGLLPGDGEGRP